MKCLVRCFILRDLIPTVSSAAPAPCVICSRLIKNAGIAEVVSRGANGESGVARAIPIDITDYSALLC